MRKLFLMLLLQQFSHAVAQSVQISISNISNYSVPDQMLGVNTENTFPYKNNAWKRWLDPSTNYTTFIPEFANTVSNLGFKSFYFPGGSCARLYHYSATGHGYCLTLSEALKMDSINNISKQYLGTIYEMHANQNQYTWENDPSYNAPHPLPPPYVEKHRDLCQLNASACVISVNILWSNPLELKAILDAFLDNGVPVGAIIMGTEVDNQADAALLPNGAADYNNKIGPFLSMLTDPFNPLYDVAFSTIAIAVNAAGETGSSYAWNESVTSYLSTFGLPKAGAINWWWDPEDCANPMGDTKSCFDTYFEDSLPSRIGRFKVYYDQMYVAQYGIKGAGPFDYANTFISQLFPLKDLFWMIDYNAVNGEFFKGAYFMKLASSSTYDPIWDDSHTPPVEINHSSTYDAFILAKEIAGKKYIHTTLTPQSGSTVHAESYFFRDSTSNNGKLFLLNSSGVADTLHQLLFDAQLVTGQITVRSTSASALLTPKSSMNSLTTATQTSSAGYYNIVIPGYSIIVVDFIIASSTCAVTTTATPSSICEGASSALLATGAITYSWLPSTGLNSVTGASVSAAPLSTTTYTVTGTNSEGCSSTSSVTVAVSAPIPAVLFTTNITQNSAILNWTTVSCAVGYKVCYRQQSVNGWTKKKIMTNTSNLEIFGLSSSTVYQWKVATKRTDGSYTAFTPRISFVTLPARFASGDHEQDLKRNVSIFPNPTSGAFHIELNLDEDLSGEAAITVINAMGLVVSKQISIVNDGSIDQQIWLDKALPDGIYFINVNISDALFSGKLFLHK